MKYEYMLHTWGGFYNEEFKKVHGLSGGYHYFSTNKDRCNYLAKLRVIEKDLGAHSLASTLAEGYHTRVEVVAHRISKYKGKEYHTECVFPPCYPHDTALYHIENKWYLGFNDYPLGEDFDYENEDIAVVSEWVTGAFVVE